jgi:hypothetical protein
MAVDVDLGASSGFPLTITWYWYDTNDTLKRGEEQRFIYDVVDDSLYREYWNQDMLETTTFIADHLDYIGVQEIDRVYEITITASMDTIAGTQQETRVYESKARPNTFY